MNYSKIIDISPVISPQIAVWPGDRPYNHDFSLQIAKGHNIDLSSFTTTVHVGAHADAPSHYAAKAISIERVRLEPYLGPAQVTEVRLARGARIRPSDIGDELRAPRLLIKTGSFPDPNRFNQDFNSLSAELIEWLAKQKTVLVGIDTPSIDPFDDKVLESHQALAKSGLRNLEGLILRDAAPGLYSLIALPLPLQGADASPVRAVLLAP
ncbi:MAG TPA: cyclase family protein [Bdellovibrionales bacterium]|nr:cyclase family protein [Bdellovibrionales bacterium]